MLRVLFFWLLTMAVLAVVAPISKAAGEQSSLVIGAASVPITFALTLLFIRWESRPPQDFGFSVERGSVTRFGWGLLIGLLLVGLHTAIMAIAGYVRWTEGQPIGRSQIALVFLTYLLLSAREELAFRGFPLRKLASDLTPWKAQMIIALLFAIEHLLGGATWPNAIFGACMGSLVFGMATLLSRGLALPIGIHAAWNFGDWARGGKGEGGIWISVVDPKAAEMAQITGMAAYVAVMALALGALWFGYPRARLTNPLPIQSRL